MYVVTWVFKNIYFILWFLYFSHIVFDRQCYKE